MKAPYTMFLPMEDLQTPKIGWLPGEAFRFGFWFRKLDHTVAVHCAHDHPDRAGVFVDWRTDTRDPITGYSLGLCRIEQEHVMIQSPDPVLVRPGTQRSEPASPDIGKTDIVRSPLVPAGTTIPAWACVTTGCPKRAPVSAAEAPKCYTCDLRMTRAAAPPPNLYGSDISTASGEHLDSLGALVGVDRAQYDKIEAAAKLLAMGVITEKEFLTQSGWTVSWDERKALQDDGKPTLSLGPPSSVWHLPCTEGAIKQALMTYPGVSEVKFLRPDLVQIHVREVESFHEARDQEIRNDLRKILDREKACGTMINMSLTVYHYDFRLGQAP